jgi:hypothetical protein
LSPAKLAVTGTFPTVWLTEAMLHLADPVASVVPVQLWAVLPAPRVKVTVLFGKALPKAVSTPDRVAGCPLVAVVAPV